MARLMQSSRTEIGDGRTTECWRLLWTICLGVLVVTVASGQPTGNLCPDLVTRLVPHSE